MQGLTWPLIRGDKVDEAKAEAEVGEAEAGRDRVREKNDLKGKIGSDE